MNSIWLKTSAFIFFQLIAFTSFSQNYCGFDDNRDRQAESIINENIRLAIQKGTYSHSRDLIMIPVVFHVMHDGVIGNVSDAQINDAIDELNLRFSNSAPYTHPTGHLVNIQFCLASVDPNGNPSNGINRINNSTYAYLANSSDLEIKNQSRWAPLLYMNVWLVADIPGAVAGYATYPDHAGDNVDGIVMESGYLNDSYVLTHEVGHYFLLYHTFEGGCTNSDCTIWGDNVCDTPPDASQLTGNCIWNSCSTDTDDPSPQNPFTSDVDELPNYMDYTLCPISFTQGQATRMEVAFLTYRSLLGQSNGCGSNPGGLIAEASIEIDSTSLCTGQFRLSSVGANTLYSSWDFDEDGIFETVGNQLDYAFNTSGFKTIRLASGNIGGSDTAEVTFYARVPPTSYYPMIYPSSGITIDPFLNRPFTCANTEIIIETAEGFSNFQWNDGSANDSLILNTTETFSYELTATDAQGRLWRCCQAIEAEITPGYAITSNIGDTVSCGTYVFMQISPVPYYNTPNNVWYRNGEVMAQNQYNAPHGAWNTGLQEFYLVNTSPIGCVTTSPTYSYFVPEVQTPTISQHNDTLVLSHDCLNVNWFLDGQVILTAPNDSFYVFTQLGCYHAWCNQCGNFTTDEFCVSPLILNNPDNNNWKIVPNPSEGIIQILNLIPEINEQLMLDVYAIDGKLIYSKLLQNNTINLDNYQGLYQLIIRKKSDGKILFKSKIILQ